MLHILLVLGVWKPLMGLILPVEEDKVSIYCEREFDAVSEGHLREII